MMRVQMPPDTNQETTKTIKRSVVEAWPGSDENLFREQLEAADAKIERMEARERAQNRMDYFVNIVVAVGIVGAVILLVSGA